MYTFDSQDDFSLKGLLKKVTDGNGVMQTITYSPLIQDQYEPFYTPTMFTETFPNIDIVAAPNFKIVTKLEQQSVGQYKKQIFRYLGAVSNTEGIGFIGFRSTMKTDWYADESKMISNVSRFDISQRGANIENYSVLGYHDPLFPMTNPISRIITKENYTVATSDNLVATQRIVLKPNTIIQAGSTFSAKIVEESNNSTNTPTDFITKSILTYESNLLPNKVFKLQNTVINQFNNLEGTSNETINTYDDYNNVTNAKILAKEGSTVVQTSISDIVYQTPTISPYILGRPSSKTQNVSVNGDSMSNKEVYTYNGNQLLTIIEKSGTGTSTITEKNDYDNFGNITRKTITAQGLTPRVTSYEYDLSGRFLTKNIDVEGLFKTFDYNLSSGVLNSETNQNRLTTTYEYDKWFKKTKTIDYLGKSNSYVYTRSSEKSIITNNGDDNSSIEETFDDLGRKVKTKTKDVAGNFSSVDYLYDIYDRNYKISEPYFGSSTSQFNEIQYDVYGRITKSISFNGKIVDNEYTPASTIVTIKEGSKRKIVIKDAIGNITSMTDTPGGTVTYKYFANGKLRESDFGGVKTTITQDGWGRKTKLVDSSAGTYSYEYNDFGEIVKETTPNGTTSYLLDEVGKLKEKTIVGGAVNNSKTTYVYDGDTKLLIGTTFEDFLNGTTITEDYGYDSSKRINKKIETTPYAKFTKDLTYDAFGRIYTETSTAEAAGKSSSKKISNTYNNGSHWQILDGITGSVLWQTNTLNAKGNILTALNGPIKITNSYDNYNYVSEFKYDLAATPTTNVLTLGTVFDAQKGNLTSRTNNLFNRSETFKYDSLDRLIEYTNSVGNQQTQSYDERGRITQNNVGVYNYSNTKPYQNTSIDVTPNALSYYTGKPTLNVTYNAFKSPVQIEEVGADKVSFTYNDSNNRSAMFYGGLQDDKLQRQFKKYYAADGTIEVKQNNSGAVEFLFYIGGDGYSAPLVFKDNVTSQNYLYLLRDYQGTITAIVNQTGAVVEKRLFDAWGDILKVQDGAGNTLSGLTILDRGYTGHEHLQSVGIVHMNGRLYDPKLHRFLQPDNFVQDPFNTQNYNRYGYCWNNPLRYTDASGEWIHIVIGAVIGGVINWGVHGFRLDMEGLKAFGVGAVAGAVGAATGGAAFGLAGGASAGAGGFAAGAFSGGVGAIYSSQILSLGNNAFFGDPLMSGKDMIKGIVFAAVTGGLINGSVALLNGKTFWLGTTPKVAVPPITIQPAGLAKVEGSNDIKTGDYKISSTTETATSPTSQNNVSSNIDVNKGYVDLSNRPEFNKIANYHPQNNGAMQGTTEVIILEKGLRIDRFGSDYGSFFSPEGTPMQFRALPPGNTGNYNVFEVLKPFPVESSVVAPAFYQVGTGTQYLAPTNAKYLQEFGYILKLTN
ncbi:glycohydrolase toxin TNT-related protein [Flavobacterium sp. ASV13]|uniref:glycohydrolase toxin TNT-related protein n=1 Tax=Flavobacterium sp. ASV13 TaxID=1506583 RepID=UPI0005563468|nr:glycohydrolase toxin TNT-related protein [Flavobacterium sp. ASV13]